ISDYAGVLEFLANENKKAKIEDFFNEMDSAFNISRLDNSILEFKKEGLRNIDIFNMLNLYYDTGQISAALSSLKDTIIQLEEEMKFTNGKHHEIIDGAPGTGKSYEINQEIVKNGIIHERVTFHRDYEYHNFVGSILPCLNEEQITYKFSGGPFTRILNSALEQPNELHYLVIEELTRGNASAVFGDIFQLLDRGEDGWSEYPITNFEISRSLSKKAKRNLVNKGKAREKVQLPPNLTIVCTINSSDQNIYPLDTAFKRRFNYRIKGTIPNQVIKFNVNLGKIKNEQYPISWDWIQLQKGLNKYILETMKLKEDKQIGPYFIRKSDSDGIIQSKLAMYMWNDLQKVHTISQDKIFDEKKVQTLYEVDRRFKNGSKEEILEIFTSKFRQELGIERHA
ncbi:MAG: AAA family ATPase, partial [Erysipelotrichaceae bacterium]